MNIHKVASQDLPLSQQTRIQFCRLKNIFKDQDSELYFKFQFFPFILWNKIAKIIKIMD